MQGQPDPATLADKMAIQEQIRSYCRAVDRLDIALGHGVFHEDSHADYGADFYQGPGRGVINAIITSHDGLLSHSHQVTNVLIEVNGETAGSESYVTATLRIMREDRLMQIGVWARYLDHWEKRDGCWAIVKRMVVYDHEDLREASPMGQKIRSTRDAQDPSYSYLTSRKWGDAT